MVPRFCHLLLASAPSSGSVRNVKRCSVWPSILPVIVFDFDFVVGILVSLLLIGPAQQVNEIRSFLPMELIRSRILSMQVKQKVNCWSEKTSPM